MSLSESNSEKPFIFSFYQISKLRNIYCISINERLVVLYVSIYLIPQVSLRYIALLRTTFYKVFPFFPRYAVHSIVLPESNMIHLIRLFMTFNRKYAICVELSWIEFHLAVMKQNTLYNKFSSKTISKKQKNYSWS